jgi:hypothetical protein
MTSRLSFILLLLVGCNPVKQVLSDKSKLDKVAKEVVKMGYCANDTTIITKSDTLVEIDTLTIIDEKPFLEVINDTVYVTKWKTNNITKSVTIHDTIRSVVVDKALVNLLKEDVKELENEIVYEKKMASNWKFLFIFLFVTIILTMYVKYKRWL